MIVFWTPIKSDSDIHVVSNDRSINSDHQRARLSCSSMNMFIITRTRLG